MRSLVVAVLYFLMLTSCKPPDTPKTESSVLADGAAPGACACNDLACWDKQTKDGVSGQLSCVQDALGAAANLASAGSLASAQMLAGISNLYQLGLTTYKVSQDGTALNIMSLVKAILDGESNVLKYVFGADFEKAPGLACFKSGSDTIRAFMSVSNNLMGAGAAQDGLEAAIKVFKALGSTLDGLVNGITTLDACVTQLTSATGPSAEVAAQLKSVMKAWSQITAAFNTVMAFSNCGLQLYKGGSVLIGNTMCLMDDLNKLSESRASLQRARIDALNRPAPNQGTSAAQSCNDEPNNCNTFAMGKFGLWLGQQSYFSYATRTYLCADMCGNKGAGSGECQKYADEIFQGDVPSCKPICNVSQCDAAVAACVSFCCDQDGGCVNTAHEKMRTYNR